MPVPFVALVFTTSVSPCHSLGKRPFSANCV